MSQVVSTTPIRHDRSPNLAGTRRTEGMLWQNIRTALPLVFSDFVGLAIACFVASFVEGMIHVGSAEPSGVKLLFGICAAFVVSFYLFDLYPAVGMSAVSEFRHTVIASTIVMVGVAAAWYIQPATDDSRSAFVMLTVLWLMGLVTIPTSRLAARNFFSHFAWWSQPIVVVGSRSSNAAVFDAIRSHPQRGLRPVRDGNGNSASDEPSSADVETLCREHSAHRAILTSDSPNLGRYVNSSCSLPHVHVVSRLSEQPTLSSSVGECTGLPELHFTNCLLLPSSRIAKRLGDLLAICLAAPLLVPLCIAIALITKITSPGPVLYCQRRLGVGGTHFYLWKFRSMVIDADRVLQAHLATNPALQKEWELDRKLKNDPRITPFGKFIRKTSLDELPQLWNVLVGEMSLVGPRPIVDAEIGKYGDVYQLYKQVKPGITGIWQISGRNNTTYEQRLSFDRHYVNHWSPWLDAFILLRTVKTVLLREGAY